MERTPTRAALAPGRRVPLEDVLITSELARRSSRPANYAAECRAQAALVEALARSGSAPSGTGSRLFGKLVETALELCCADSAGLSLLETEGGNEVFRWRALAGQWAKYQGSTMPRHGSPCGTAVELGGSLLLDRLERHYPFPPLEPPVAEALLVPFSRCGRVAGTIWVVAHNKDRRFDGEDERLLRSLAGFAATALQVQADRVAKAKLANDLASELAAAQQLHRTSTELISEGDVKALYDQILDAAIAIMRSDFASIQMLHSAGEHGQELHLLGHRGFSPGAAEFWGRVHIDSSSTCAAALRAGHRVIMPDVAAQGAGITGEHLEMCRRTGIRAIQSTPLLSRRGQLLGMISTHWSNAHAPSDRELRLLDVLARQAADLIERSLTEAALRESEQRFRLMADTAPAMLCVTEPDGSCSFLSRGWYEFTGQSEREGLGLGWLAAVHPDDRATTCEEYLGANERQEAFAREHRVRRADGEYRWVICTGRPRFGPRGTFTGFMVSVIDISDRKRAEDSTKMLLREVSHRAKNLLTVVQALARQTAGSDDPRRFAELFSARLASLAACQDLLVQSDWRGVEIGELIRSQLAPFGGLIGTRIQLDGPALRVSPAAAQTLGMALHELATNASKYGALSKPGGTVEARWQLAGEKQIFEMAWLERGGPPVTPPRRQGFGYTVIVRMVEHALDAEVALDHSASGLHWRLRAPAPSVLDGPKRASADAEAGSTL